MAKFKPKKNQNYFMINSRWEVKQAPNTGSHKANGRIAIGNCFKTQEEAELFRERLLKKVPMSRLQHFKAIFE